MLSQNKNNVYEKICNLRTTADELRASIIAKKKYARNELPPSFNWEAFNKALSQDRLRLKNIKDELAQALEIQKKLALHEDIRGDSRISPEITEIIDRLDKLKEKFDLRFITPDESDGACPWTISYSMYIIMINTEILEKTLQFEQKLSTIQEMRKNVSCSDLELLENLDRSITEFSEQINEQKLYYTQEVEKLKISNENAEKVRQEKHSSHIESQASLMKENPARQSQHGFFASVKKIAIPVGVAAAGIMLTAVILKCV